MKELFIEALVVGILVVIFGTLASFLIGKFFSIDLPPACKDWNKNYVMEISLFVTGIVTHLICEAIGLNKWYCKNGKACS